jgi:O-antigen/teichoic acid export membrane protein
LFPAFSRVEDRARLKRAFLGALGALALVTAPLACALSLYSELVVRVVLGPKWSAIAPALAWLAWAGLARALGGASASLLDAAGSLKTAMSLRLLRVVSLAGLLYALAPRFGFTGTAAAVAAASVIAAVVQVIVAVRSVGASWFELPAVLKHAALACLPFVVLRLVALPLDAAWQLPAALTSGAASLYFVARGLQAHLGIGFTSAPSADPVRTGRA